MTLLLSRITYSTPSEVDIIKSVLKSLSYSVNTYIHNEEVKPTPGVGEVFDKAVCDPFQEHLQDENIGEDLVCILQHYFDGLSLLDVNVLKRLSRTEAIKCAGYVILCKEKRLCVNTLWSILNSDLQTLECLTNNTTKCGDSQLQHSPYHVSALNPLTQQPL